MPYFTLRKSMAVAAVTELAEVVEATIKKGRGYQIYIALSMTGSESVMLSLPNKASPSPSGDGDKKTACLIR